jgi:sugar phosphate isomerase/epimerase
MKRAYEQILDIAERYKMIIDIEPHGYYTTKPEFMEKMLAFVDSPYLRMNMDTGNTYIAGQDPVAFLNKFKQKGQPCAHKGCERILGCLIAR